MAKITRETVRKVLAALPGLDGMNVEAVLMRAAFNLVANPDDWRAPIDTVLDIEMSDFDADIIADAVQFMTSTHAKIEQVPGKFREFVYHVTAKGYRAGPAGDH